MKFTTAAQIARMANAAKGNPDFLAWHLDRYCTAHEISAASLCAALDISIDALPTLCLCIGPRPGETPADYCRALIGENRLGLDVDVLLEILEAVAPSSPQGREANP